MSPFQSAFSLLSPNGMGARLSVFMFHRVLPAPDPLFPGEMHAKQFDLVCGWIARWFNVLPLDEAVKLLGAQQLPERAACVTFDDGYRDNHDVALPLLLRHGLSATFFIATGFLDGGRMWNDSICETVRQASGTRIDLSALDLGQFAIATSEQRRTVVKLIIGEAKYLPDNERRAVTEEIARVASVNLPVQLMMTSQQVKALHLAGMQIGAHTVNHPILARLSDLEAKEEIAESRNFLERLLGERVCLFAYPNGKLEEDYTQQTVAIVRDLGFDAAVCTKWGVTRHTDDMHQIRRFTPWDKSRLRFGARLAANFLRT